MDSGETQTLRNSTRAERVTYGVIGSAVKSKWCPCVCLRFLRSGSGLINLLFDMSWEVKTIGTSSDSPTMPSFLALPSPLSIRHPRGMVHACWPFRALRRVVLVYNLTPFLPLELVQQRQKVPPPFDLCPDFPTIFFDRFGIPHPGLPNERPNVAVQIVPPPDNPYARRFGFKSNGWQHPAAVVAYLLEWLEAGGEIVIHDYHPGVQVTGIGRGMPRFLRGGGFSLFIGGELGLLPDGFTINESMVTGMVATFAVSIPDGGRPPSLEDAAFHLIPSAYLCDPVYPGLQGEVGPDRPHYELPPPPEFRPAAVNCPYQGFSYAEVTVGLSLRELEEDGVEVDNHLFRGRSYRHLMGFPHIRYILGGVVVSVAVILCFLFLRVC